MNPILLRNDIFNRKNVLDTCKLTGILKLTRYNIKNTCNALEAKHAEKGLPKPTINKKVARKLGSERLKVLIDSNC